MSRLAYQEAPSPATSQSNRDQSPPNSLTLTEVQPTPVGTPGRIRITTTQRSCENFRSSSTSNGDKPDTTSSLTQTSSSKPACTEFILGDAQTGPDSSSDYRWNDVSLDWAEDDVIAVRLIRIKTAPEPPTSLTATTTLHGQHRPLLDRTRATTAEQKLPATPSKSPATQRHRPDRPGRGHGEHPHNLQPHRAAAHRRNPPLLGVGHQRNWHRHPFRQSQREHPRHRRRSHLPERINGHQRADRRTHLQRGPGRHRRQHAPNHRLYSQG